MPKRARTHTAERTAAEPSGFERAIFLVLLPIAFALLAGQVIVPRSTWGWDESMHAGLPAARMALALQLGRPGDFADALLGCEQYPFVWPVALGFLQALFGVSEGLARTAGFGALALFLSGLFLLAEEAERELGAQRGVRARHLALLFAVQSPLLLAFAPTVFLEIPCAAAAVWTLWAWLRTWRASDERSARRWALAAGGLATLALFTKFNYGMLLVGTLALDGALRIALGPRETLRSRLVTAAWLFPIPSVAIAWWFAFPWPGDIALAASHRATFAHYVFGTGYVGEDPVGRASWPQRVLNVACYLSASPLEALIVFAGVAGTLGRLRAPLVRTLWIALLCGELPPLLHTYHLERFLIPGTPALFVLAGLGWSRFLARLRPLAGLSLLLVPLAAGWLTAPAQDVWLAGRLGVMPEDPELHAYVRSVFERWSSPDLRRRNVPTAGLPREESDEILSAIETAIEPDERVVWLGSSSELSPGALHLGLLERGGSRERFLADAHRQSHLTVGQLDPNLTREQLLAWAGRFDAIVFTDPPDLKARKTREFLRKYLGYLVQSGHWPPARVADLEIARPRGEPLAVRLYVCKKAESATSND